MEKQTTQRMQDRPPRRWVSRDALRPGDILFASGERSDWLKIFMALGRAIDGAGYNHCGIYEGEGKVIEAGLEPGVVRSSVDRILNDSTYTDIHRFIADDKQSTLGKEGWPSKPVTEIAESYIGTKYSMPDAVLAALLLLTRRGLIVNNPIAKLIRGVLETAIRFLQDHIEGIPPESMVTCSELVYRAFNEAPPEQKYRIRVRSEPYVDTDLRETESRDLGDEITIPLAEVMPFAQKVPDLVSQKVTPQSEVVQEILDLATEFEALYRQVNGGSSLSIHRDASADDPEHEYMVTLPPVADYVSPGDLVRSWNTIEIGRIEKGRN